MSQTNYSIRLDSDLRDRMREVPEMTNRIREFISQEVARHQRGEVSRETHFCGEILDEYGTVGGYSLRLLEAGLSSGNRYLKHIEERFEDTKEDVDEARLAAKRIRTRWNDFAGQPGDVLYDVLEEYGYIEAEFSRARSLAQDAVKQQDVVAHGLWTVVQLFRAVEADEDSKLAQQRLNRQSIVETLSYRGYDEEEIDRSIQSMVDAGVIGGFYSSNAYSFRTLTVPDYLVDAFEEGLQELTIRIRSTVEDYVEEPVYLEQVMSLTSGDELRPYEKNVTEDTNPENLRTAVSDGAVVLRHRPGRSSTGRRSSLPSRTKCILAPSVRETVSGALFRHASV